MAMCKNLACKLKEIKAERGVSVTEFSEQLEISRSSLQSLLSCKGNPRIDTVEHIAQKLQIDPIVLLKSHTAAQEHTYRHHETTEYLLEKIIEILGEEHE